MKRLLSLLVLSNIFCLRAEEELFYYYEPWRYESYPFPADPYYYSYHDFHYDGLRKTRYYYVSTSHFDLSQPYAGFGLGYAYGNYSGNPSPYAPWWNKYALFLNLSPKKILELPKQVKILPMAGAALVTFKEDEPQSPLDWKLAEFLGATNHNDHSEAETLPQVFPPLN